MTELFFALVGNWGLWVIGLCAYASCLAVPVPTFAVMLAGGALAASGDLVLWQVLTTAYIAALAGDQTGYRIGRWGGTRLTMRLATVPERAALIARAKAAVARWGGLGVFFSTWAVAPLGPWVNLTAGAAGLGALRFTLWDAAGEAIWVGGYVLLGYTFSAQLETVAAVVSNWGGLATSLTLAVAVAVLLWRGWRRRRGSKT